jgi:hypothetical protein
MHTTASPRPAGGRAALDAQAFSRLARHPLALATIEQEAIPLSVRRTSARLAVFWSLATAWLLAWALNGRAIAGSWRVANEAVVAHVPNAIGMTVQSLFFTVFPFGCVDAFEYDPLDYYLGHQPTALFWPIIFLAPVLMLVLYRRLSGRDTFVKLAPIALILVGLVVVSTLFTPGSDGILVLLGPPSRIGSLDSVLQIAGIKLGLVLPYALLWVGLVAPGLASIRLRPLQGGSPPSE